MGEPLIRKARLVDLPTLADIERDADKLFLQTDMPDIGNAEPTDSAALAALLGEGAVWVAELDGAPVGFLAAGTRQDQYVILQISVVRSGQGRGVGARLMETALDHGRAVGAPDVILTTFRDIRWNAPWYARFGFVEIPEAERSDVVRDMQAHEAANGRDMSRRCAMRAPLAPWGACPGAVRGLTGMGMDEESRLIRAGAGRKPTAKTVAPAIQRGSTVLLPTAKALYDGTFGYGRSGLNAQHALCEALCELEGAREVELFPSGLAAVTAALMAVLKAGDHILVVDTVYKPVRQFCDAVLTRFGVAVDYYDARLDAEALLALATPATRLILLESPGSLTFEMQDVPAIAAAARARGVLTLIDNTWGAGLLFKPLAHGVDLSVQALTKYVCGHSDVFMGSVAVADPRLAAAMQDAVHEHGWAVTGDDAYQALRGLRTLAVRMARHGENGLAVARWLQTQPQVQRVIHPALPGDPGHAVWARDYSGACGLFAVVLQPGPDKAVEAFLNALKLFGLGFSWGGFESLAINCDPQFKRRRIKVDYGGPVIRLHVGLESPGDLIADLEGALTAFATC